MISVKRYLLIFTIIYIVFSSCSTKDDTPINNKPEIEHPGSSTPNIDHNYTDFITSPSSLNLKEYYKKIDFTKRGQVLKKQLHALLEETHQHLNYTPQVWESLKITDINPNNAEEIIQIYGWPEGKHQHDYQKKTQSIHNRNTYPNASNQERKALWEREHVFAKSNAFPRLATSKTDSYYDNNNPIGLIAGTDVHNLRPVNGYWNNVRSNLKFADGSGNSGKVSGGWYPGDEWKGDIARMMMYMHVRYGNQCVASKNGIGRNTVFMGEIDGMIDLYLKWNAEDPVSDFERYRNEYHGNKNNSFSQGNRNPFIDNPYLANAIWGMHHTYKAGNNWTNK